MLKEAAKLLNEETETTYAARDRALRKVCQKHMVPKLWRRLLSRGYGEKQIEIQTKRQHFAWILSEWQQAIREVNDRQEAYIRNYRDQLQTEKTHGFAREMAELILDNEAYPLKGPGPWSIGRSEENYIVISEPSVSRRHAQLSRSENGFVVEDLGSLNSTLLNGVPIDREFIGSSAELTFGRVTAHLKKPQGTENSSRRMENSSGRLWDTKDKIQPLSAFVDEERTEVSYSSRLLLQAGGINKDRGILWAIDKAQLLRPKEFLTAENILTSLVRSRE